MDELKNISVLLFTCGDCRPDTLAPAHTGIAASTLRYPPVNHSSAQHSGLSKSENMFPRLYP